MNTLLNEVITDLEMDIKKTNAVIRIKPLPELLVLPTQIRQLFQNLLSNSIKFSKPDNAPEIDIFSERIPSELEYLSKNISRNVFHRIYFRDNGIGFDSKYSEDIFTVFKRLHGHHEIEGTGIGLSICKKIVERHRGTIMAESEPGKGATFVVTLPERE
jgi:light-regulated signal transduction histidine kinase (bacteriophytochrome)